MFQSFKNWKSNRDYRIALGTHADKSLDDLQKIDQTKCAHWEGVAIAYLISIKKKAYLADDLYGQVQNFKKDKAVGIELIKDLNLKITTLEGDLKSANIAAAKLGNECAKKTARLNEIYKIAGEHKVIGND